MATLLACIHQRQRPQVIALALREYGVEAGIEQQLAQPPTGKAGVMRHVDIAARNGATVSIEHVERRDRAHRRNVGDVVEVMFEERRRDRFQDPGR